MKKIVVIMLCALGVTFSANAQNKFGHISINEVVNLMTERDSAVVQLNRYQAELIEEMEAMQTEYNNKINTYQQKQATWSTAVRESKEAELQEIVQRIQTFEQTATNDLNNLQNSLMSPIYQKAQDAIDKVAKSRGLVFVFDTTTVLYIDAAQSTDLLPLVKTELGIPAAKVSPTVIE
ncbi:MAG: OmpH family outer membrane protein [Bacteroidales bacterium]|nr:OmpH family outer membrane protein [Bacteroidales bacterium]